jgi:hypothetical protein
MTKQRLKTKKVVAGQSSRVQRKHAVSRPSVVFLDHDDKQLLVFTRDILVNQLRRDGPKIEATFDRLCDADLHELSDLFSQASGLIFTGLKISSRNNQKLEAACAFLLVNASSSLLSATTLLRTGFVLQPGILIRSVLEAISTVLYLLQHPEGFSAFEKGKLQSTKTISAAKAIIPIFGQLYGRYSEDFVHISHLHQLGNPITPYTERHEGLEANLTFLRTASWLLYVTAELLFNELVSEPRYWHPKNGGYEYNPSLEERAWMTSFFHMPDPT